MCLPNNTHHRSLAPQTYVGEILVAVNPFKYIKGIYDKDMMSKYSGVSDRATLPPHIFAVADAAFSAMVQNPPGIKANQVTRSHRIE